MTGDDFDLCDFLILRKIPEADRRVFSSRCQDTVRRAERSGSDDTGALIELRLDFSLFHIEQVGFEIEAILLILANPTGSVTDSALPRGYNAISMQVGQFGTVDGLVDSE